MKCLAKDRNLDPCRNYTIDVDGIPTKFCKFHQYMNDYTPEMLNSTRLCTGCKKMRHFVNDYKICEPCRTRDISKYKKTVTKCAHPECEFKKSDENEYCGKHQLQVFIKSTAELGKKVCYDHIRGCRAQLDSSYPFSKCRDCLDKESASDRKRRHEAMSANPSNDAYKICTICCKEQELSMFVYDDDTFTKTCQTCRSQNKVQNARRDRDHRNLWTRTNLNRTFYSYQQDAEKRDIEFHLTKDEFMEIIKEKCVYCGDISEEKQFNGVDRVDSKGHYTIDNCVSACTLCNYLKHAMPVELFFQRIEHILTYSGKVNGKLHPQAFPNVLSGDYDTFERNAIDRNLEFQLSRTNFSEIIKNKCYLCGKEPRVNHRNGIDRFNNSLGYTIENARPCCSTCNIMKNRYSYADMICKFEKIYELRIQT
jgi:hypothetical protein